MGRGYGCLALAVLFLCGCSSPEASGGERELPVEALSLSELYDHPPKVVATLTVLPNTCEHLERRRLFFDKTFTLGIVGFKDRPADAECPAVAQAYDDVVILDEMSEPGEYTVVAGERRATFVYPEPYVPETALVPVRSVDVALQESFPAGVVAHIVFASGCDPEVYKEVTQRREGDTFFVTVRQGTTPPELPPCPPVETLLTESVTLTTDGLEPGTYEVNVNGVVKSFTLP